MTDYKKLVEALRRCANRDTICTTEDNCGYLGKGFFCTDALMTDAADAIEALMPKRGEWKTTRPDAPMFGFYYCSICGRRRTSPQDNYCPNCGAKMEVQE